MGDRLHIVIIALHYGPEGSGGARRPTLMAEALRELGHRVQVVTPYPTHAEDIHVSHPIRKHIDRDPSASPGFMERMKRPLRRWRYFPEPEIRWARSVVTELPAELDSCDVLLTTSPPESVHLVGHDLAERLGANWIADFRDTWTLRPHRHYVKGFRAWVESALARRWLKKVSAILAVDEIVLSDALSLSPSGVRSRIIGHFSAPFRGEPTALPANTFNLVHSGGFTRSDHRRKLDPLLNALGDIRPDLHLHVAGPLTEEETRKLLSVPFATTHHGWLDLEGSRALQAGADALLLYTPDVTDALPGKYAEYLQARKPIVFMGADNVRGMAQRGGEFVEVTDLAALEKGETRKAETQATARTAALDLLALIAEMA